jgi:hypothetical protein
MGDGRKMEDDVDATAVKTAGGVLQVTGARYDVLRVCESLV